MRPDLHEVLIERPRRGHRPKTARGNKPRAADWVDADSYADSYRPRRQRTKYFDDLLSPLERWLRRQVGRPWDKVWSELASGIDSRSVVGRHLLDHMRGLVTIDSDYDAAQRTAIYKPHVWPYRAAQRRIVYGLYVDPRSGLLRWREPPPRRLQRRGPPSPILDGAGQPLETRVIAPTRLHLKRHGIWYDVEIAAVASTRDTPFDLEHHAQRFRITRKRQLNSRELTAAGLTNDA